MHTSTFRGASPWIAGRRLSPSARLRLFCFPYAGVGVSAYRSWMSASGPDLEICPVQLPGRESRHDEAPFQRMEALAEAAVDGLRPHLDVPFAFFGHSLGALVAYEVARRVADEPLLRRLFVSARRAPHLKDPQAPVAHLPNGAFVATVQQRYGGIPAAVLECSDLMELLIPRMRADFEVLESYVHRSGPPLPCGISVFAGDADSIDEAGLRQWEAHTHAPVQLRTVSAGHLYLESRRAELLEAIAKDLAFEPRPHEVGA